MTLKAVALLLIVNVSLIGCSTTGTSSSRYQHHQDFAPSSKRIAHLSEPTPRNEAPSKQGNKPIYQVWGKSYRVLPSANGFTQVGTASWYGMKFHGHKTANGEIYDVYKFSAAHKNLPLPTYVRVTNLANGKNVVVRVNDRGPFHGNRIIDLSYAAAIRIGMHKQGTARVKVEALTGKQSSVSPLTQNGGTNTNSTAFNPSDRWVQVGAYRNIKAAFSEKKRWQKAIQPQSYKVQVYASKAHIGLYRIYIGPIKSGAALNKFIHTLRHKHAVDYPVIVTQAELVR